MVVRKDNAGDSYLATYLVASQRPEPPPSALKEWLARVLPEYMLPSVFVWLPSFPLTAAGKVDRAALPAPEQTRSERNGFVAANTPEELLLASIWADVLGVERVGIHDNFFELGGNSLSATRVLARFRGTPVAATSAENLRDSDHSPPRRGAGRLEWSSRHAGRAAVGIHLGGCPGRRAGGHPRQFLCTGWQFSIGDPGPRPFAGGTPVAATSAENLRDSDYSPPRLGAGLKEGVRPGCHSADRARGSKQWRATPVEALSTVFAGGRQ